VLVGHERVKGFGKCGARLVHSTESFQRDVASRVVPNQRDSIDTSLPEFASAP